MIVKMGYGSFISTIFVILGNFIVSSVITDVRLVDGPSPNKGTIEIRQDNGTWETTCGVYLGINDVIVICRQLGFTGANRALPDTPYGQSSTPAYWLNCNGGESDLSECWLFNLSYSCPTTGAATCHGDNYLGCFAEEKTDRVLSGINLFHVPEMTISYCIQYCNNSTNVSYVFAGVEFGNECFCGEASDDYTRHGRGSDVNCQSQCSGDPTESCGGLGYIAVFSTVDTTPYTTIATSMSPDVTTSESEAHVSTEQLTRSTIEQVMSLSSETTAYSFPQIADCSRERTSTLVVGVLLGLVSLYGITISFMYMRLRRSNNAQKQTNRSPEQELDPYSSLDVASMQRKTYEDLKSPGSERSDLRAKEAEKEARIKKLESKTKDNLEPEYEIPTRN